MMNTKINVKNDITIQKYDLSIEKLFNVLKSVITLESDIINNRNAVIQDIVDKLTNNKDSLQNITKYCNNWYFRDMWSINQIDYFGVDSEGKITILPTLDIFDEENFNKKDGPQKFVLKYDILSDGIYVYDFKQDVKFNIPTTTPNEYITMKGVALYYFQIEDQTKNQQALVLLYGIDTSGQNWLYSVLPANKKTENDTQEQKWLQSVLPADEETGNDIQFLTTKIGRKNLNTSDQDGLYTPSNRWVVNKTFTMKSYPLKWGELLTELNYSVIGDIFQYVIDAKATGGIQEQQEVGYVFKYNEDTKYNYFIVYTWQAYLTTDPLFKPVYYKTYRIPRYIKPEEYTFDNIIVKENV